MAWLGQVQLEGLVRQLLLATAAVLTLLFLHFGLNKRKSEPHS